MELEQIEVMQINKTGYEYFCEYYNRTNILNHGEMDDCSHEVKRAAYEIAAFVEREYAIRIDEKGIFINDDGTYLTLIKRGISEAFIYFLLKYKFDKYSPKQIYNLFNRLERIGFIKSTGKCGDYRLGRYFKIVDVVALNLLG